MASQEEPPIVEPLVDTLNGDKTEGGPTDSGGNRNPEVEVLSDTVNVRSIQYQVEQSDAVVNLNDNAALPLSANTRTLDVVNESDETHACVKKEFLDFFSDVELSILENIFLMANMAQDNRINVSELKFFLDLHNYVISDQEARQIIKQGDIDGDLALSFREFLFLCRKADLKVQQITHGTNPGGGGADSQGFLDSIKIRKIFQAIFATIDFRTDVKETVEFFENKIAASAKALQPETRTCPKSRHKLPSIQEERLSEAGATRNQLNTINSPVEIGYDGDTAIAEIPSVEPSKESLVDEGLNVEGIIKAELLRIEREVIEAESQTKTNPLYDYDLIVIGGTPGGTAAAKEASKYGKRVAICEYIIPSSQVRSWGWRFGGSCINVGCVPKMLVHHSGLLGEYIDKQMSLPFGWFSSESVNDFSVNWTTLIDSIQSHIRTMNYERQFGLSYYKGIKYYNSICEFDGSHRILLTHDDQRKEIITGEKILIAVGSIYRYLEGVSGSPGNCITVDDVFSLRNHPGKVLIVGGGPDAIECAGLLCRLNIEVTLMSRSQALKGFDRRIVTLILESLHSRGVKIMIGWSPTKIENDFDPSTRKQKGAVRSLTVVAKHTATGERACYNFNTIVLAVGKMPCTPLLKLDKADVLVDDKTNKIWVDSQDMTTAEDIFALGDCAADRPSDTPISYQAGVTLSKRLFEGSDEVIEYEQTLPKFLMTPVQYASIGLSEEGAIVEHGQPNVIVYHSRLQPLQHQLANRYKDTYYAKLITLKPEGERVIGLHYLGPNAGEVIQGFTLAMKFKATKADFDAMIGIHPTCAEIFSRMSKTSAAEVGEETSC